MITIPKKKKTNKIIYSLEIQFVSFKLVIFLSLAQRQKGNSCSFRNSSIPQRFSCSSRKSSFKSYS